MPNSQVTIGLQLRSLIKRSGELELSIVEVELPTPDADEVILRIEAAPINPTDIWLMLGPADMSSASVRGADDSPVFTARVPPSALAGIASRADKAMPVGSEGAGVVVKAGSSAPAQSLLGKMVAAVGGSMYAQYRTLKAADCLLLPEGTTAAEGASCFVNPLTALGMVETMHREGHKALVHTAAASNLGQMLNRICQTDGIGLVNIVRSADQERILRGIGAKHVCNSQSPLFVEELTAALDETGATLAFDAVGGGKLAGQILACMEAAISKVPAPYRRYGSNVHKQVYIYGGLDPRPTEVTRNFGFAWGMGGWLLFPFLSKIGLADAQRMRTRVVTELKTTFASSYTKVVSLPEMLQLDNVVAYAKRATGEKFLVNPNK